MRDQVDWNLGLYDVRWPLAGTPREVSIDFRLDETWPWPRRGPAAGRYLATAQSLVDAATDGLYATMVAGGEVRGEFSEAGEYWRAALPTAGDDAELPRQVDDVLMLAVTTGWRRAGWLPLHGAGLARPNGTGLICCATSGGGKTTFVMAMLRRGWRLLGDDKLLLGGAAEAIQALSLQHSLNVDPRSRDWFPDLEGTPDPRPPLMPLTKVRVLLSEAPLDWRTESMTPTDVIVLRRGDAGTGVTIAPLPGAETVSALLRQTVIPRDPAEAHGLVATLVRTAQSCRGWVVSVAEGAYALPDALDEVDRVLR